MTASCLDGSTPTHVLWRFPRRPLRPVRLVGGMHRPADTGVELYASLIIDLWHGVCTLP
jgi:hypothetical protein